jgi:tetratricopeptide (TPR) repeat protein
MKAIRRNTFIGLFAISVSSIAVLAQPPADDPKDEAETPKPAATSVEDIEVSEAEAQTAEELFQAGRKEYFQGKHLESIKTLIKASEKNPMKSGYKLLLAKAHRAVKQDGQAIKVLESLIKANPEHVEAGLELAELISPTKEPERVIALLEPLLKFKHTYPLYHMLGEAHYEKEELKSARKYFEDAIKLNPQNKEDHYQLGNIYLSQKRFARAGRSYRTASDLGMSSGVFHFKLASVYFNLHNYLGKISKTNVIGGKPGQTNAQFYLIDAVAGAEDTFHVAGPQSAIYQVAKSKEQGIDIFALHFLEANIWQNSHYYKKADAIYASLKEKVAKEDAGLFWAQWADTALGLDDYDEYINRLNKAIELQPEVYKPTLSDALKNVARRYQQRGKQADYIVFLKKAINVNPLSASLHLTLGDAYWTANDQPKAIQQYKLVLELEPEYAQRIRLLNRIRGTSTSTKTVVAKKSSADEPDGKELAIMCMMSDQPAFDKYTMNYKGGKLYFCCDGCQEEFTSGLAKFSAKANHHLLLTKQAKMTKCPFTGRKLNPAFKTVVKGAEVTFCCSGCKAKTLKQKPDDQVQSIFNNIVFSASFQVSP